MSIAERAHGTTPEFETTLSALGWVYLLWEAHIPERGGRNHTKDTPPKRGLEPFRGVTIPVCMELRSHILPISMMMVACLHEALHSQLSKQGGALDAVQASMLLIVIFHPMA